VVEQYRDIYLCLSTGNQTINLMPALQYGYKRVLLLSTDEMERSGRTMSLNAVCKDRGIGVEIIHIDHSLEKDIARLALLIEQTLSAYHKVIWNLSGGQKLVAMACQQVFNQRIANGHTGDEIMYVEGKPPAIWHCDAKLVTHSDRLNTTLTLSEIMHLYGTETSESMQIFPALSPKASTSLAIGRKALAHYRESELFRDAFFRWMKPLTFSCRSGAEIRHLVKVVLNEQKESFAKIRLHSESPDDPDPENTIVSVLQKAASSCTQQEFQHCMKQLKQWKRPEHVYKNYWEGIKRAAVDAVIKRLIVDQQPEISQVIDSDLLADLQVRLADIGGEMVLPVSGEPLLKSHLPKFSSLGSNGVLFEWMVAAAVFEAMEQNTKLLDGISEIHMNCQSTEFELDLVIVTRFGTLILFEMKTFDFSGDLIRSKENTAYKKSGVFAQTLIVGPLLRSMVTEDPDGTRHYPQYVPDATREQEKTTLQNGIPYVWLDEIAQNLANRLHVN
jgi:hypothetical protein